MARREALSEDELFEMAAEVERVDGRVTVARLREAAGGGSRDRLKAIVEAYPAHKAGRPGADTPEVKGSRRTAARSGDEAKSGTGTPVAVQRSVRAEGAARRERAIAPSTASEASAGPTAEMPSAKTAPDPLAELIHELRRGRSAELAVLSRLVARQTVVVEQLGRLLELNWQQSQAELAALRAELESLAARLADGEGRG